MEIIAYSQAKKLGLKFFFNGKPCKNGHVCERFTSSAGCIECSKEKGKLNHSLNRERNLKRSRDRYWGRTREHDIEYAKQHYIKNREYYLEYSKKYRNENPEKARKARQASWVKYRGKYLELNKKWRKENPDACKAIKNNRRARKIGNGGSHTSVDIQNIRVMQKDKCAMSFCRVNLDGRGHEDHIIPLSKGGNNDKRNIQLLCSSCNARKYNKDPLVFSRERGLLL